MPAISARTAPAEITLMSAAFAAVANTVRTVASTEAKARLIAFLPCSFCREGEIAIGSGVSLRARARHTSGCGRGAVRATPCYNSSIAQTREEDMRRASITKRASVLAVVGVAALAVTARAGGDKVAFPADYAKGVVYMTLDRPENKQVREYVTSQAAVDAAKKGDPLPQGTVITVAQYAAQPDAEGNPVKDS